MADVASGAPKERRSLPHGLWLKMWHDVMKRMCRTSHETAIRHAINDTNVQYFSLLGASNVQNGLSLYLTSSKMRRPLL